MTTLYGLPEQVIFCRTCTLSNQRPNSCVEYLHTIDSKKATVRFVDGICDACRIAERKKSIDWDERERELRDMLDRYRGDGSRYDILVPGSGGKDSFFQAHVLKHKYGMHPLLITWSPAIYTDVGWRNLQRWQEIADHQLYTPSRRVHRLLTRISLETLFHIFAPFIYGQKSLAPKVAKQYGIKLIAYGEQESDYGDPMEDNSKALRDAKYHSGLTEDQVHLGGVSIRQLKADHGLTTVDLEPYMPMVDAPDAAVFYLGYYLRWRSQDMYYYAVDKCGFECSPERTPGTYSKYVSLDDAADDLHYLTTFLKFGIGRATYDSAQEIRNGEITREEGVALVNKYDGEYPERYEKQVFDYLSVPGFEPMTREYFWQMAERFKSPHLWSGQTLRHRVA